MENDNHQTEPLPRCDILLLVATDTEEEELKAAVKRLGLSISTAKGHFSDYLDLGEIGNSGSVYAVRTSMGPLGYHGSAAKALHCKMETGAIGLICLGMAFGCDPSSQQTGDVLVSTSLLPYDSRDVQSTHHCHGTTFTASTNTELRNRSDGCLNAIRRARRRRTRCTSGLF